MRILKDYKVEVLAFLGSLLGLILLINLRINNTFLESVLTDTELSMRKVIEDQTLLLDVQSQINVRESMENIALQLKIKDQLSLENKAHDSAIVEYRFNQIPMKIAENMMGIMLKKRELPIQKIDITRSEQEGYVQMRIYFSINTDP